MTPCEELGYKVGDEFEVLGDGCGFFNGGEILTLKRDDGTDMPYFTDEEGIVWAVSLNRIPTELAPLKKAPIKPEDEVTITTTYGDLAEVYAVMGAVCGASFGGCVWGIAKGLLDPNQKVYNSLRPNLTGHIDYSSFQGEWLAALFTKEDPKTNQLNEVISTLEKELIKAKNQLKEIKGE